MEMENLFNTAPIEEAAPIETEKKAATNSRDKEMISLFKKTMEEDADFKAKLCTRKDDIIVVNSLSYGTDGGLIPDKSKPKTPGKDGKLRYKPIAVPEIVGYRVKNVSKQPIEYIVSECTANAEGIYEVKDVQKVLKPGETADLPRKYFTMLLYRPEFSFTLGNGKVVPSKKASTPEELLTKPYFSFSEKGKGVHDEDVKVSISKEEGDKTVILKEYVKTFGFLNNPTEKAAKKTRGAGGRSISTQELAANYIRQMCEGGMQN